MVTELFAQRTIRKLEFVAEIKLVREMVGKAYLEGIRFPAGAKRLPPVL